MDTRQKRLVRNIVSGAILLCLLLFVLAYCGVFEGAQSDEAQIRALLERSRDEMNDHDWDDFFDLCDLTGPEKRAWEEAVPRQANLVVIDAINPQEMISVPAGAGEYELNVTVIGHLDVMGRNVQGDVARGTLYFVKKDGRWYIDVNRSAPTFPYVPRPNLPK